MDAAAFPAPTALLCFRIEKQLFYTTVRRRPSNRS